MGQRPAIFVAHDGKKRVGGAAQYISLRCSWQNSLKVAPLRFSYKRGEVANQLRFWKKMRPCPDPLPDLDFKDIK